MKSAKQYQLQDNELILRANKSSVFIISVVFLLAIFCFLMPLTAMIVYMANGNGFHIGFLFGLFIFGIMGFYLLRVALWNTYGREEISIHKTKIRYIANYGWFKDGKRQITITEPNVFSISQIGSEAENKGVLVIGFDQPIVCVTKMPNAELEELIEQLNDITTPA